MSYLYSPHFGAGRELSNGNGTGAADHLPPADHAADSAVDTALRAVPLPDGLMTRLGRLVYTMTEDAPDQVDWLGC
jgi:hypothetical protein